MKKAMVVAFGLVFLLAGVVVAAEEVKTEEVKADDSGKLKKGDRMELIKFDKGEICGDGEATLSKEKPEKGKMYCAKITIPAGKGLSSWLLTGTSGILKGKRGNWNNYDTVNVKYINTLEAPIKMGVMIGDQQSIDKWNHNYVSKQIVLQPGENVLSLDISGLVCVNDRALDLTNVRNLGLTGGPKVETETVLYIQSIYLEKE
ncbi:MAG: hypothetical protein A2231_02820 [Candidatus Firestonebacteria bacterium RIFOXYA2_FULL_40_8]|nr:MAG: hypothetical protein A2231_02820 [Candidatus Firestonebacteria bacterium RIFOXYA2_FULL_40_8]